MEVLPNELIVLIIEIAGPAAALIMSHTNKSIRVIIMRDYKGAITEADIISGVAQSNSLDLLKYMTALEYRICRNQYVMFVQHGNLPAIKYLNKYIHMGFGYIYAAITYGQIDILDYIYSFTNNFPTDLQSIDEIIDPVPIIAWIKAHPDLGVKLNTLREMAARTDNLELYKLVVITQDYSYFNIALRFGSYNIIKYIHSLGIDANLINSHDLPKKYNREGIIKSVKFILDNCSNVSGAIAMAVIIGDLDLLKYTLKYSTNFGLEYIWEVPNLEIAQCLIDHGFVIKNQIMCGAINNADSNMARFHIKTMGNPGMHFLMQSCVFDIETIKLIHSMGGLAIRNNDYCKIFKDARICDENAIIEKLEFFHAIQAGKNKLIREAYKLGSIKVLEWFISHGYTLDTMYEAEVYTTHPAIYDYLYKSNIPVHYKTIFKSAITYGMTDLMVKTYCAIKNAGVTLDHTNTEYCHLATESNMLGAIKLLRSYGFEWDKYVFSIAAESDCVQILKYMVRNNCPVPNVIELLLMNLSTQVEEFLIARDMI